VKVYQDFKDDISFELHPAVRNYDANGNGGALSCVDENGCFWEKMTLCAFNQANGTAVKVQFLDCMDSRGGASMPTAPAEACSSQLGLDYTAISKCYTSEQGEQMLEEAAKVFRAALIASIPHIFVDGNFTQPDYVDIKKAICALNTTAAAC
jgi:hypothetical protein